MLISKIANVCHGSTICYMSVMVKFSNTTTYSIQIFQSNENNGKVKESQMSFLNGGLQSITETCDKN